MANGKIGVLSSGMNQSGVRNYNERLLLSMLQRRHQPMSGIDLARRAGLSAQTVSIILRKLESDGLLLRGTPIKGKVGKPSIPMDLAADGVFSFGLKVGHRSAELLLMDFKGEVREQISTTYAFPLPGDIFEFLHQGLLSISSNFRSGVLKRICGIGIAIPFELWKWDNVVGEQSAIFQSWKQVDFKLEVEKFSDLSVFVVNDSTAACRAEHLYGRGKEFRDYAYFFIGAFVGGGVVINHTVFEGNHGNAGALGSLRSTSPLGESRQLIDVASIHVLETRLIELGVCPELIWEQPQDWGEVGKYIEPWISETAQELAKAALSVCSVIDFEAILIDGAFPTNIRTELVERVRRYMATQDTRGLIAPRIEVGNVGINARAIGAASGPIFSQYLLNTNAGLSAI
ncbi:MAG: ROK family transcriptional regulator [Alphaproteobacteria bacterium]|nr:ROK family transcriptional regulator [Alphaproteobacteria bacterium]